MPASLSSAISNQLSAISNPPTADRRPPTAGFTLIEIMVSVSVVILLTALAIPNLNRFNEEQLLRSEADKFVSVLRQAQTNGQARIQPDGTYTGCAVGTSLYWQVRLINNTNYSMGWVCDTPAANTPATSPKLAVTLPANILVTGCGVPINFQNTNFSTTCTLDPSGNIEFTFNNARIAKSIIVALNQGGSINVR